MNVVMQRPMFRPQMVRRQQGSSPMGEMLDPNSVVRSGEILSPDQRKSFLNMLDPNSVVRSGEMLVDPNSVVREGEMPTEEPMNSYTKALLDDEFRRFLITEIPNGQNILEMLLQGNTPENFSALVPLLNEFTNFKISNEMKEQGALPPQGDMIPEEELIFLNRLKNMAEGGEMTADAVGIADGLDAEEEMMTAVSEPSDAGIAKVSPDQYVQLMNEVRGDDIPLEGRVQELAMKVGEKDAQDTPLSVLALVQPVFELEEQGGIAQTQEAQSMSQPMMPTAADQLANPQNMGIVRANTGLFINSADAVPFAGQDMSMSLKMPTENTAASSPQNYDILQGMMSPNQYDFITKMGENMFDMGKAPVDITQRAKQYEEKLLNNADLKSQFLTSVVSPLLLQTAQDILDPNKSFSEILMGGFSRIGTAGQAGEKLKQPYKTQALNLATKDKEIQATKQSDFVKLFGAEAIKKAFAEQKNREIIFQNVGGVPIPFDKDTGLPISSADIYYTSLTNTKMEQINKGLKLQTAQSVKNLFPDLTNEELIQIDQDTDYFVKNSPRFKQDFYDTDEGRKFKISQEDTLRKEYLAQTKDFSSAVRQFSILDTIAADSTGATDMALVFTYMKILDPTSVVRDSEFGLAASTDLSMFENISLNTINKILNGQTVLTPKQRATLISAARGATLGAYRAYEGVRSGFENIVDERGLSSISVLPDFTSNLELPTVGDFDSLPDNKKFDYYKELEKVFDLPLTDRGKEFNLDNPQDIIDRVNK